MEKVQVFWFKEKQYTSNYTWLTENQWVDYKIEGDKLKVEKGYSWGGDRALGVPPRSEKTSETYKLRFPVLIVHERKEETNCYIWVRLHLELMFAPIDSVWRSVTYHPHSSRNCPYPVAEIDENGEYYLECECQDWISESKTLIEEIKQRIKDDMTLDEVYEIFKLIDDARERVFGETYCNRCGEHIQEQAVAIKGFKFCDKCAKIYQNKTQ